MAEVDSRSAAYRYSAVPAVPHPVKNAPGGDFKVSEQTKLYYRHMSLVTLYHSF